MTDKRINEFETCIKQSPTIHKYLEKYLSKDFKEIIEDYGIEDDEIHIMGYCYNDYNDTIEVSIGFFDACSETGAGNEDRTIKLSEFLEWLKHKR